VTPQRPRSFEFAAGFLAGQKGGNLPKSETVLHKVNRNELFRFSPAVPSSSPLMQSLTIGRAIGTGAPRKLMFFLTAKQLNPRIYEDL